MGLYQTKKILHSKEIINKIKRQPTREFFLWHPSQGKTSRVLTVRRADISTGTSWATPARKCSRGPSQPWQVFFWGCQTLKDLN